MITGPGWIQLPRAILGVYCNLPSFSPNFAQIALTKLHPRLPNLPANLGLFNWASKFHQVSNSLCLNLPSLGQTVDAVGLKSACLLKSSCPFLGSLTLLIPREFLRISYPFKGI